MKRDSEQNRPRPSREDASQDWGKVAVLMGGPSAERDVSLKGGAGVLAALKRRGVDAHAIDPEADVIARLQRERFERAFIVLHGRWGEDGVIQGALETIGMPYTGSGVLGSALGMDKLRCKHLWHGAGIPVPDYVVLQRGAGFEGVVERLGLPLFVKPVREGSSLGVTKVKRAAELAPAFERAAQYDDYVLAERAIAGAEVTCAILEEQALPLIRIEAATEFYDYEAKYIRDDTRYHCPSGLAAAIERRVQDIARRAFELTDCRGWGRVDFMLDADGAPYVLEINTVPGMTDHSLVPKAARQAGIEFDELVLRVLATSERRR
jgi:D-alanine-D-alanine ligase